MEDYLSWTWQTVGPLYSGYYVIRKRSSQNLRNHLEKISFRKKEYPNPREAVNWRKKAEEKERKGALI